MYLLSKRKFKLLIGYFLVGLLFFLPFKKVITNLFSFFSYQFLMAPESISRKNQKLEVDIAALRIKIRESEHLYKENRELWEALNFKADSGFDLIIAGVINFSPSSWRRYLVINAGRDSGVKGDSLAVDKYGRLIGKIASVSKTSSQLLLINDPNFNLPVFVGDSGLGLLKGNLTGAKILYIEKEESVKKGDRVWAKAGSSAAAIPVGKVKTIKKVKDQLFCEVTAELDATDLFFDKVFIIK